jgi:hypothetical protein
LRNKKPKDSNNLTLLNSSLGKEMLNEKRQGSNLKQKSHGLWLCQKKHCFQHSLQKVKAQNDTALIKNVWTMFFNEA